MPNDQNSSRPDIEAMTWEDVFRAKRRIECQLGARKLEAHDLSDKEWAEYLRWRASALRALLAYEERLSYLRGLAA